MRRLTLMAVSILAVASMAVSPALAHDWNGDGWDEEWGSWVDPFGGFPVDWDVDWDDSDGEDANWWNADCVVEDVDWSGVFEEWEVELACS